MIENQSAVAEGEVTQDAKQGESSAPNANQGVEQSASGAAKPAESSTPFHKNPEFQDYLGRQKKSWDREWNTKLTEMQKSYDTRFQQLQQSMAQPGQPLNPQDVDQLKKLFEMGLQVPEIKKMYGLDTIQELKSQLESLISSNEESRFNSEMDQTLDRYSKKYGYDKSQLRNELKEYSETDEYWLQHPYTPGGIGKLANDYFADKQQDLAQWAANMKLVTENNNKKRASSEKPTGGSSTGEPNAPKSMREAINQSMSKMKSEGISFGA